eukprot:6288161-Amphidinium_carterae.3
MAHSVNSHLFITKVTVDLLHPFCFVFLPRVHLQLGLAMDIVASCSHFPLVLSSSTLGSVSSGSRGCTT